MELFANNEYEEFKEARKEFTEENSKELNQASGGFRKVTDHFEENYMHGEVASSSILQKIIKLFKRKQ